MQQKHLRENLIAINTDIKQKVTSQINNITTLEKKEK